MMHPSRPWLICLVLLSIETVSHKVSPPCNGTDAIYANTEWDTLREVIVGGAAFVFPFPDHTWKAGAAAILPGDDYEKGTVCFGKTNFDCCTGTPGIDIVCPDEPLANDPCCNYMLIEKETEKMIEMLKEEGVKVQRPKRLTTERLGANWGSYSVGPKGSGGMDIFPRDIIQVIENVVIDMDLGAPNRRGEVLGLSDLFKHRLPDTALHISMPQHDFQDLATGTYDKTKYPVIEGGDVMLLGDTILVGVSDNTYQGSSNLGVDWLRNTLRSIGIHKTVEAVRLDQRILHLDLVMSAPRQGVAVVATKPSPVNGSGTVIPTPDPDDTWLAFPNGLPAVLDTWTKIEVTGLAGMYMATNAIPVSPEVIIMANNSDAPAAVQEEMAEAQQALRDLGMKVKIIDFKSHGASGGAMRCSTHPLQRWSTADDYCGSEVSGAITLPVARLSIMFLVAMSTLIH